MPSQTWVEPVVLEGSRVRLEPLRRDHLADLALVAFDPALWRWTIMGAQDEAGLRALGRDRPRQRRSRHGTAVRDDRSRLGTGHRQQPVHVDRARSTSGSRSAGPGSAARGSGPARNREAKLLQLTHAFETLGANRVEFKTHSRNERSRNALAGIGATFEGVFRSHTIMADGSHPRFRLVQRDRPEWPAVKSALEAALDR